MFARFAASSTSLLATFVATLSCFTFAQKVPACDTSDSIALPKSGKVGAWVNTTDATLYVNPGKGACGFDYRNVTDGVCVNGGWIWSANKQGRGCNMWVQIYNPRTQITAQARVVDSCGGQVDSTFGCDDIYVTLRTFQHLSGPDFKKNFAAGHIDAPLTWQFISEPCWACEAGFRGTTLDNTRDTCQGMDSEGLLRCGRKRGDARVVGQAALDTCSKRTSCPAQ